MFRTCYINLIREFLNIVYSSQKGLSFSVNAGVFVYARQM